MRHVAFIMEDGFQVMGLAALSAFEFANLQLGTKAYSVSVVSENGGSVISTLGLKLDTAPIGDFPDTLMVLGRLQPAPLASGLREYIIEAAHSSRRVAGVCTGAFALAEAGLLDGKSATTHWAHAKALKEQFPLVRVDDDRIFIKDGKIWTSAGMSSVLDLTLALIEEDYDAKLARAVARNLVVYHRRSGGQSQFSAMLELEPRSDRVKRALNYAKENLRNPLTVDELADAASLSPRQFTRLFRSETGQSPAKAVERLRLEAAKAMLEDGRHPMDTVARDTGFADRDRMRRAFLRYFGHPPQTLRRNLRQMRSGESSRDTGVVAKAAS